MQHKINLPSISKLVDANNVLGEGPLWDASDQVLYWVDILSDRLFTYSFRTNSFDYFDTPKYPSTIALCKNKKLLLAVQGALVYFDATNAEYECFVNVKHKEYGLRFNDGKVDPLGVFWIGSKDCHDKIEAGSLVSIDGSGLIQKEIEKLSISNGMCWDKNSKKFYFIDSFQRLVWSYDYSMSKGTISNPRVCINFLENEGYPDGMTIDKDGFLWIAMWEGWGIFKCSPITGERLQFIHLPVAKPTSCVFGGDNLDTLFVTSARVGLSEKDLVNQPDAGAIFAIKDLDSYGLESDKFINIL